MSPDSSPAFRNRLFDSSEISIYFSGRRISHMLPQFVVGLSSKTIIKRWYFISNQVESSWTRNQKIRQDAQAADSGHAEKARLSPLGYFLWSSSAIIHMAIFVSALPFELEVPGDRCLQSEDTWGSVSVFSARPT